MGFAVLQLGLAALALLEGSVIFEVHPPFAILFFFIGAVALHLGIKIFYEEM